MALNFTCTHCGIRILPGNSFLICLNCPNYECCSSCQHAGKATVHSYHSTYTLHIQGSPVNPGQPTGYNPFNATNTSFTQNQYNPTPFPNQQNPTNPATPQGPTHSNPERPPTTPESYWGTLITQHRELSYTFTRLCDSIFHHFTTTSSSLIMDPQTFGAVFDAGQIPANNNYPWHWYTCMAPAVADATITRIFKHFGWEYFFTAYPAERMQVPVLTKDGFRNMMRTEVLEDPESAFKMLNALLAIQGLVNPATEKGFEYRVIPRGCFPGDRDEEMVAMMERLNADLMSAPEKPKVVQEEKEVQVEQKKEEEEVVQKVEQVETKAKDELPDREHEKEKEQTQPTYTTEELIRIQRIQAMEAQRQMIENAALMMQEVYCTQMAGYAISHAI